MSFQLISMIEVNNLTTVSIDKEFLKKVAEKVLEGPSFAKASEGKGKEFELSIALVGQGRIRELNKRYRGENKATDVLSFSYNDSGEIVICLREVKKNAKRFSSTFGKELATCLIHGILHLLGYNHEISEEKAKEMEEKQNYYLEKCQKLI